MRFSPTRMYVAEAGCLYLFRADVQPPKEPENAKMRRGKAIHVDIEHALTVDSHVMSHDETLQATRWARDRWDRWQVEIAIGINPKTGAVRQYPDKDAIPQTCAAVVVDIIGYRSDVVDVYDWKTGSQFSKFDYSSQVRLNGYAVAMLHGRDEIASGLAYPTKDDVAVKTWSLDEFDLAHQRQKLRVWAEQAPTAEPVPCAACKYCPARVICPAQMEKSA